MWFRVWGFDEFRVSGGFRTQGLGFWVHNSGFRVQGSGFRELGSGSGVQDLGWMSITVIISRDCEWGGRGTPGRVQGSGFRF
jgi:hypothetical protein